MSAVSSKNTSRIVVSIDANIIDFAHEYLQYWRTHLPDLFEALRSEEFEQLKRDIHKMKGSGGMMGFEALVRLGQQLEDDAEHRRAAVLQTGLQELDRYFQAVEITERSPRKQ
jgi:HPt (histidine-containing phosphotransfer) domain-containing protein